MVITYHAYAKVNLCLAVEYPPCDGYHQLRSVFQTVGLHDTVTVYSCVEGDFCPPKKKMPQKVHRSRAFTDWGTPVVITCTGPAALDLPAQNNIVFRAVNELERIFESPVLTTKKWLWIDIEKHIPAGAGLGGGSSDAAATIAANAQVNHHRADDGAYLVAACKTGADVAFFLHAISYDKHDWTKREGGAALMEGCGGDLVCRVPQLALPLVLMGDTTPMSTERIYKDFDANPQPAPDADALAAAMKDPTTTPEKLAALCVNNLESAACAANPRLAGRIAFAKEQPEVLNALISGSGSTSYAVCRNAQGAHAFAKRVAKMCDWVYVNC